MHEERASRQKDDEAVPKGAIPAYLMDREGESRSKVCDGRGGGGMRCVCTVVAGAYSWRRLRRGGGGPRGPRSVGPQQHGQAEAQGKGGQVGRATATGQGHGRGRSVQGPDDRQEAEYVALVSLCGSPHPRLLRAHVLARTFFARTWLRHHGKQPSSGSAWSPRSRLLATVSRARCVFGPSPPAPAAARPAEG